MAIPITSIRLQFPILQSTDGGHPLVYLDSAATAQKPIVVLDAMDSYYKESNANVHRSMHAIGEKATIAYEDARSTVQNFLKAKYSREIIFAKNCTEALNLVAKSWGKANLRKGDVVVLSLLEHHSNVVPWLQLKDEIGITIEWIEIDEHGNLLLDQLDAFLAKGNVKLVSITGQSNVLGVCPPLKIIIEKAHKVDALVCVDAAQLVAYHPIDLQDLDCDFLLFSGHKLYGPTGIGVLYGKSHLLEEMPPFLGGGTMIHEVKRDYFTPAEIPAKFEAGTPPIAEAVGLHAAIDWFTQFDWKDIEAHEQELMSSAIEHLSNIDGLTILCKPNAANAATRSGCISFTLDGIHPHDLTEILGRQGICLRAGHHCTQPLHEHLGINASTRLSFGIYNTKEEIFTCATSMKQSRLVLT